MRYKYSSIDQVEILDVYKHDEYYKSWYKIVRKILKNKEFQKRRLFLHHENESLWTHLIKVSFNSYKFAIKHGINSYNCAIAGLLHDFYTRAWQDNIEIQILDSKYRDRIINKKKEKIREMHAFYHPVETLENSRKYFKKFLNKRIENAILTHMFPLSLLNPVKLPKYKESLVVTLMDKYVSMYVIKDFKNIPKYAGLAK